jgi:hypothetical protein
MDATARDETARRRWRRIADRSAAAAAVAAMLAFVLLLAGGEGDRRVAWGVGACIVAAFVAQGVFFWAFVAGGLYRPRPRAGASGTGVRDDGSPPARPPSRPPG